MRYHQGVPTAWEEHALATLRRAGYHATGARAAIVAALSAQECCRTAQEIHEGLRGAGQRVGVASVYRALELLTSLGLVQRVDVGGSRRFEPVLEEHHHHVVCDACGRVEPFTDPALERAIEHAAGGVGYTIAAHEVVLRGSCGDCADVS